MQPTMRTKRTAEQRAVRIGALSAAGPNFWRHLSRDRRAQAPPHLLCC